MTTQPKAFDYEDVRNPLLQARAITELVRLVTQSSERDELRPETLYEVMVTLEDILDAALAGLQPLVDEEDRAIKRLWEGGR